MKRTGWFVFIAALLAAQAAWAQAPKLEKTHISLSVGGSISQMNKIAYFVALNRKYFEQEGLEVGVDQQAADRLAHPGDDFRGQGA